MRNPIIAILVLTLLATGCCNDCDNDRNPTYLLDQDFKNYIVFPLGSYWIYTTDLNEKDSVHLYQQTIDLIKDSRVYPYKYQLLKQNLWSSFFSDTLFGGSITEQVRDTDTIYHLYVDRFMSSPLDNSVNFFNNLPVSTVFEFTQSSKTQYVAEMESYFISDAEYKNVRIFENLLQNDDRLPQKIYYAEGVGIIRKELFNGQNWNLERHFINN